MLVDLYPNKKCVSRLIDQIHLTLNVDKLVVCDRTGDLRQAFAKSVGPVRHV